MSYLLSQVGFYGHVAHSDKVSEVCRVHVLLSLLSTTLTNG